jgi:fibrillarin-like rRNA methylase
VENGVLETIIEPHKSIYINQDSITFDNVKLFLETNGFKIIKVESNDVTNCEYNVFFSKSS